MVGISETLRGLNCNSLQTLYDINAKLAAYVVGYASSVGVNVCFTAHRQLNVISAKHR